MNTRTDQELLREFANTRSETAFAELVRRHVDLVHSAALRMLADSDQAKDVTQGVFVAVAQSATELVRHPVLSGWLHRTARNLAANVVRSNVRRQMREQEAVAMNELLSTGPDASWEHIAPHLDAAIDSLSEPDRDAVMLRYFEKKSAAEMAAVLGINDAAAQKRVSRAVDKLRGFFSKRGLNAGAGGLVLVISANAVQAAPAGLAMTISSAALAATSTAATIAAAATPLALTMFQKALVTATVAGLGGLVLTAILITTEEPPGRTANVTQDPAPTAPISTETNTPSDPRLPVTQLAYAIEEITPPAGFISSRVTALNNQGQAVGWLDGSNGVVHAFVWTDGILNDLGNLGGSKAIACSINDLGEIAAVVLTNDQRRALLLQTDVTTDLGIIDGFAKLGTEGNISYVPSVSLNNQSEITGRLMVEGDNQRSFLYRNGQISYFGLRGDGIILAPRAMNNRGIIAGVSIPGNGGWGAFVWEDGQLTDLKTLGGTRAGVNAINEHGTVVGWANPPGAAWDQAHAIVWENGQLHDLNAADWKSSHATGINNSGNIIGDATTLSGRTFAFLKRGGEVLDLNQLIPTSSSWRLVGASVINDRGQILAVARNNGKSIPVLVSPVDLPSKPETAPPPASYHAPTPDTPAPLSITSFERLPDGAFRLAFKGQPDIHYSIEASTNLTSWTMLGATVNQNGLVEFIDRDASKFALRFYRVVRP